MDSETHFCFITQPQNCKNGLLHSLERVKELWNQKTLLNMGNFVRAHVTTFLWSKNKKSLFLCFWQENLVFGQKTMLGMRNMFGCQQQSFWKGNKVWDSENFEN